jgi:4-hydroxy-3-polyprenylbenzoate decarboxylase
VGDNRPIVVALSGASGAPIAVRLLEWLRKARVPVALVVSAGGRKVLEAETEIGLPALAKFATNSYTDDDFAAPIASGTQPTRGMVVVPCSSNTVARLALGFGDTLVARAAHVHLKEGRRLVIVPRETPLPTVMLRHLTTLSELGVVVLVPAPAFYLKPRTIEEVTDYFVGKILDQFGLRHRLYRPWGSPAA